MVPWFRPVVLGWLLLGQADGHAALQVSGTVTIDPPPTQLRRGQTATLEFRLTNTGDEPLTRSFGGFEFMGWGPGSTIIPFPTAETPPCDWAEDGTDPLPGDPPFRVGMVGFEPAPIAPGESRSCRVAFIVTLEAADTFDKQFIFAGSRGTNIAPDFVETVRFELLSREAEIPSMSRFGLATLIVVILFAAIWTRKRFALTKR